MAEHFYQDEKFPCHNCGTNTSRVSINLELPVCCNGCETKIESQLKEAANNDYKQN